MRPSRAVPCVRACATVRSRGCGWPGRGEEGLWECAHANEGGADQRAGRGARGAWSSTAHTRRRQEKKGWACWWCAWPAPAPWHGHFLHAPIWATPAGDEKDTHNNERGGPPAAATKALPQLSRTFSNTKETSLLASRANTPTYPSLPSRVLSSADVPSTRALCACAHLDSADSPSARALTLAAQAAPPRGPARQSCLDFGLRRSDRPGPGKRPCLWPTTTHRARCVPPP